MAEKALAVLAGGTRNYDRAPLPAFALNFYSPIVEAQLRSHRKTATIRLGDKSRKYQKGMIVSVLVGARYGPRQHVFDAVIDKVDVKRLGELSPREIEHDNPEIRRPEEMAHFLGQLYNRDVTRGRHRHGDPVLRASSPSLGFKCRADLATPEELGLAQPRAARLAVDGEGRARTVRRTPGSGGAARRRTSGRRSGISASNSSNQRSAAPQRTQIGAQSPSTLRRSSRSQSDALPIR